MGSTDEAFRPARSKLEAVTRISALTNSPPETLGPGSKERKSVLVNLAQGLGLSVDTASTKPDLGAQIADALGHRWDETCWSTGQTITLTGLNRLLGGAEQEVARRRRVERLRLLEPVQPLAAEFVPARSKLEAVTRISALTNSPPETLGPGSKERKSVLVNLAQGLELRVDTASTKPDLGAQIATALGHRWDETCWSTGHTITLTGLNLLLAAAERTVRERGIAGGGLFLSARHEAMALVEALASVVPTHMDGRSCVAEMREAQYTQWAQDEWAAFYFEFVGLPALVNAFGGGPRRFANTRFDYGLGHTWDLKVHMAAGSVALLNDCAAVEAALAAGAGLGFLVLSGHAEYDDGDFRSWQRAMRTAHGLKATERLQPPKYVRRSKRGFRPAMLEAFFLKSREALRDAIESAAVRVMKQGTQASGKPRAPKYSLDLKTARSSNMLLYQRTLGAPEDL